MMAINFPSPLPPFPKGRGDTGKLGEAMLAHRFPQFPGHTANLVFDTVCKNFLGVKIRKHINPYPSRNPVIPQSSCGAGARAGRASARDLRPSLGEGGESGNWGYAALSRRISPISGGHNALGFVTNYKYHVREHINQLSNLHMK